MREYKHGGDIYNNDVKLDFSVNINPLGMPEGVRKAAEGSIVNCVNYPDTNCGKLVKEIAKKEDIPEDMILCGNGAADLIYRFVMALKPKRALLPAPTFAEYASALRMADCGIGYHYLKETQSFRLQEDFLNELTIAWDVLFLCNPNNPTSQLVSPVLMDKILNKCRENQIMVFVDESFLDFVEQGENYSLTKKIKEDDNIFILKAFTKFYAMPGLRLGYCLCSKKSLLDKMENSRQSWPVSIPAQAAGIAALQEKNFTERTMTVLLEERRYLVKKLEDLGMKVFSPEANFILFQCNKNLYKYLLEKGILIRSCHNYPGLGRGLYRIAVKSHKDNVQLIDAISEILRGE